MTNEAQVVFERFDGFDPRNGPYGWEKVGFRINDRVFWVGCRGSEMPDGDDDRELAQEIVRRWNAGDPR